METQLSREQLLSKILELNRRNDILRSELLRYKLFCNYLEKTIKVLQKYRNQNEPNINIDCELNRSLFAFKSIKLCEIKLNKLQNCQINGKITSNLRVNKRVENFEQIESQPNDESIHRNKCNNISDSLIHQSIQCLNEQKRDQLLIDNNFGKVNKKIETNNNLINDKSFETISETNINSNQNERNLRTSERLININAFYSTNDNDSHDFHPFSEEQSLLCRNECLDESERIGNKNSNTKTSEEINENNIIDKQSINSSIESSDKECNQNIDTNGKKVNNSKSCGNNETQSKFESKSIEESIDKEKRFETESNGSEDNESITAFDDNIDSIDTEIDSDFDDNQTNNRSAKNLNQQKANEESVRDIISDNIVVEDNSSDKLSTNKRKSFESKSKNNKKVIKTTHNNEINDNTSNEGIDVFVDYIDSNKTEIDSDFDDNKKKKKKKTSKNSNPSLREFKCDFPDCEKIYRFKESLINHRRSHGKSKFKCDFIGCGYETYNKSYLKAHRINHLGDNARKSLFCKHRNCNAIFKGVDPKKELRRHQLRKHPELFPQIKEFNCSQNGCYYSTKHKKSFDYHIESHSELISHLEDLKCDINGCNYSTKLKRNLNRHKLSHELPVHCPLCDSKFRDSSQLKEHMFKHSGETNVKSIRCDFNGCGVVLKGVQPKTLLRLHKERRHPELFPNNPLLNCTINGCDFSTKFRTSFTNHMAKHEKKVEKKIVCEWSGCEKLFQMKYQMLRHMTSHTKEKKFSCIWPGCEKRFQTSTHLIQHKKVHKSDVNYECDWPECDYKTYRKGNFDKHKAKHTGEKRFACIWPGCQYKTANQSNLTTHKKIHQKY